MKVASTKALGGMSGRFFSGFVGAGLVFILSLLLAGSSQEGGAYDNLELGFSLLALAGASGCVAGLISNVYRLLEVSLPIDSSFVQLPAQPQPTPGERPDERERTLPVVAPSLVLPTLISGLGGWVEVVARAPRAKARFFAA
jgi:hypothetical protein